jgi:hypothetical protein
MTRFLNIALVLVVALFFGCGGEHAGRVHREAAAKKAPAPAQNDEAGKQEPAGKDADKAVPRKIIYTGLVDLIVDDFDGSEGQLRGLVEENEGYIANSDIYNQPGSPRSGT